MRYYVVYAACLVCVCYDMQYYNCGFFAVAIALRACYCVHIAISIYCVHIAISMQLFIVCVFGIVL